MDEQAKSDIDAVLKILMDMLDFDMRKNETCIRCGCPVDPTPEQLELAEARRRFPLVPQMSDEELLQFHRDHPRGWYESEGEDGNEPR